MENREFQLGAEYQLNVNSMVGARYVNKKLLNTIEDIGYLVCTTPSSATRSTSPGTRARASSPVTPSGSGPAAGRGDS